jgi:glycosyltransferase involved in cell wall biosynthesis
MQEELVLATKPLVSILIPAYNAENWITDSIQSAVAQTWPRKEIIVVDDGSTDRTAKMVRQFASQGVTMVSTPNHGLSMALNVALKLCHGDYIQELDADDLLAPDKIERQLGALRPGDSKRILISSPWAPFYYRTRHARFVRNSLWQDLPPVEWLLRKMSENLHMQNATWLVSREVAEAAGPWDERLQYDQDGEYFARVLLASEGTRFVPGTGIFYRASGTNSISYIGTSDKKKDSLILSMKLHMQYLRSLEESERVRGACLAYMQNWYGIFFPSRPDIVAELQDLAAQLHGRLKEPRLRWKYAWMQPFFGREAAAGAQRVFPQVKASLARCWDKAMSKWEGREATVGHFPIAASATQGD